MEGRTYGGKGTATKNNFLNKVESETSSLSKVQDKRNAVVNLIKNDLSADVTAMRYVVTKKENRGVAIFCESLFWASQPKQAAKT
ncbi:hypothetical protein [Bathymodiolus platifrons methanotrophic gill symbiont]|uniref:hypothetical protein n=1 Tax=Bathymodiolus platifrons methanotrophic gill symbiont TaxID=113268 RepID=UPI001C8D4FC2|nr:hypothetical protein [Bathymodiolus platifrons methanotrophic gill symbiont]